MGCYKLPYQKNNLEVTKNYLKKELTSKRSLNKNYSKYLFGSSMPGRSFTGSNKYRFGFNGKENDTETSTQDYGFRIYNPSLGRFLSVDPLTKSFPFWTPYAFAGNTPIQAIDLDGLEIKKVVHYLDQHSDGTMFVKETSVSIEQDAYVMVTNSDGETYKAAKTITEYIYQNEKYGETEVLYEPICDGCMKPSAKYDYTEDVIDGKLTEDIDYLINGEDEKWYNRPFKQQERDLEAPDNTIIIQDLKVLEVLLIKRGGKTNKGVDKNLNAHKQKKQSTGSSKRGGANVKRYEKGLTHGGLNSKKGNKRNPNQRKNADKRGGKKNKYDVC